MTYSFISYEKSDDTKKTSGYWNNDGTILITQKRHDDQEKHSVGKSVNIKPSEFKKIIENYREDATEPLFEIEEYRPGIVSFLERIKVTVENGLILTQTWIHGGIFGKDEWFDSGGISLPYDEAKNIFKACVGTKATYDVPMCIAPLVGTNCRESERSLEA